jgi:hypothetical protein
MASTIIEGLPIVMKFFQVNIDFIGDREERFSRGCERNEQKHPDLVAYLRKLRTTVLEIEEQFRTMRFGGWNLPNVRYSVNGKVVTMIEPQINGEPVSAYVERIFDILALAIENIVMYGFNTALSGPFVLAEVPLAQRDPKNAQRFKRTMRGMEPEWQLKWTGLSFYQT